MPPLRLVLVLLAGFTFPAGCSDRGDPVVYFDKNDTAMSQAIDTARETLPKFRAELADSNGDFSVKAPVSDGGQIEHIWLSDVEEAGSEFVGRIGNDPVDVKNVKFGDPYRIAQNRISDWMIHRDGKIYGGYTLRVMLRTLPEEQAAPLRDRLAELD